AERVVPAAGPDVRDHLAGLQLEHVEELGRLLLFFALRAVEPAGRLVAHDQGNLPVHVELAGAVGVVVAVVLVPRRVGRAGRRRGEEREQGQGQPTARGSHGSLVGSAGEVIVPRRGRRGEKSPCPLPAAGRIPSGPAAPAGEEASCRRSTTTIITT